jgi:hypothetical protein
MNRFGRNGALLGATALMVALAAACGGSGGGATAGTSGSNGGGGTGGTTTPTGAVDACKALASTVCTRDNSCNARGATAQELADCTTAQDIAFGCDRATSAGFSTCLKDVQILSCPSIFPAAGGLALPASCDDPINSTPLSDAQNKCGEIASAFCDRVFMCMNVAAPSATDSASCQQVYFDQIGCLFAKSAAAAATLAQCKTEIGALPCPKSADAGATGGSDGGASQSDGSSPIPSCDQAITFAP